MVNYSNAKNIVFLTGAGISQESGIKTFRDHDGLWNQYPIEELASLEGYYKNPQIVHEFYNLRRLQLKEVQPNRAHIDLAKLEFVNPEGVTIITQNVDDLHERAGSKNVIHMHGELRKIRNLDSCEVLYFEDEITDKDFKKYRPHIVWFGEEIFHSQLIYQKLKECDLFVAIGTSATVYPAAQFASFCRSNLIPTVELNIEATGGSFDLVLEGKATEVVEKFISKYLYARI